MLRATCYPYAIALACFFHEMDHVGPAVEDALVTSSKPSLAPGPSAGSEIDLS